MSDTNYHQLATSCSAVPPLGTTSSHVAINASVPLKDLMLFIDFSTSVLMEESLEVLFSILN